MMNRQPSVLVVDDDEFSREVLRRKLLDLGVTNTQMAHDGLNGICVLDGLPRPPDFIVCDIFMPDMDGIEFLGELAKRHYQGGLILVTGVNLDMLQVAQNIATGKGLKMLGVLIKPLKREELGLMMGLLRA
jgi:CheY-like chemotaxis protein